MRNANSSYLISVNAGWPDTFIPDEERWLHEPEVRQTLDEALAWAESHPRRETDLDELEERLSGRR